ncbi:GNAT family N-acetyltransferase [Roseomonas sp. BN140053]|uniref:GNAT family N-acetyltransferase n=1 Tax=Roseomonas sp. BN140053 TaxID=3391898 RepID=UPI0039EC0527
MSAAGEFAIRDIRRGDLPAVAALNDAQAPAVNAVGPAGLEELWRGAFRARVIGSEGAPLAFLLAFDGRGTCRGPNHAFFRNQLPDLAYLDRIAVAPEARRQGLARRLHADLAAGARAAGLGWVGCEVNLDPPNPTSLALHAALGFRALADARDPRNGKLVRYLARPA